MQWWIFAVMVLLAYGWQARREARGDLRPAGDRLSPPPAVPSPATPPPATPPPATPPAADRSAATPSAADTSAQPAVGATRTTGG